ncbi:MAG: hypothetical protein ACN6PI_21745, partial [Sphingobacterium siyangense]
EIDFLNLRLLLTSKESNRFSKTSFNLCINESVSDFVHLTTTASGHNIMLEEPTLVISAFSQLLGKL